MTESESDIVAGIERRTLALAPAYGRVSRLMRAMFFIGAGLLVLAVTFDALRHEPLAPAVVPIPDLLPLLLQGDPSAIVSLAILWMMAAPVVATAVVLAGFIRIGDRRYAFVTGLVLAVLAVSILRALR